MSSEKLNFTDVVDGNEYQFLITDYGKGMAKIRLAETNDVLCEVYLPAHILDEPSIVAWVKEQFRKVKHNYTYGRLSRRIDFMVFKFRKGG